MEKLTDRVGSALSRGALAILIVFVMAAVAIAISSAIWNGAATKCPADTFASGELYSYWNGWAVAAFGASLALLVMNAIVRFPPFTAEDRARYGWSLGRIGTGILALLAIGTGAALWLTASAQICLADSGVYLRTRPWHAYRQYAWSSITRLDVNCRNRSKEPDLYYVVTFKDGTTSDIADALGFRAFKRFRAHLANVPFAFSAKVGDSCPEWFADWVGQRP